MSKNYNNNANAKTNGQVNDEAKAEASPENAAELEVEAKAIAEERAKLAAEKAEIEQLRKEKADWEEKAAAKAVKTVDVVGEKVTDPIFTYVGAGDSSPQVINFMGLQMFRIGKPEIVTYGSAVHKKIKGNPAFREGEVPMDEIIDKEVAAQKEVAEKKAADKKLNDEVKRKHRTDK